MYDSAPPLNCRDELPTPVGPSPYMTSVPTVPLVTPFSASVTPSLNPSGHVLSRTGILHSAKQTETVFIYMRIRFCVSLIYIELQSGLVSRKSNVYFCYWHNV